MAHDLLRARVALALLFALLVGGCYSSGGSGPYPHGGPGTGSQEVPPFSGTVVDEQGQPVPSARVEVNGRTTATRADGTFQLQAPSASQYILNISHPGFADFSFISRAPLVTQRWKLTRAQVATVDPTGTITLTDTRPELAAKGLGGATFTLPPDSLVDSRGVRPAGPVRAAIATLDVSNGEGPGDWAVRSDDGRREGFLVSYGAVFVQFTDAAGTTRYQLRSGRTGQLSLPVLPSMRAHAPGTPTARFWYYDATDGLWKHNGNAVFDTASGAYRGSVNHLSVINTDIAKFDNAACLAITLDPSIPVGHKLRIRYHSGGTPFGQTPTFVMNDTLNAAYRLPANTNVLLELYDLDDTIMGTLVVEDPAGNPLVNTVVNTGTAIPEGDSLWPPFPYTPCKPILLRIGLPQVELRINELEASPLVRDDPTDDYITWAPTFCLARLSSPGMPITIVLTNDDPNIPEGGDVLFAANEEPWPVNTTATANTLTLDLPANGSWVPFVIAGKQNTPTRGSTNDKDTIIEAHLDDEAGAIVGSKALMVRVRKNANNLTAGERSRFLYAFQKFRNELSGPNYVRFQEMHRLASSIFNDQGHGQPAFLPWHRAMLLHVERELQKHEPSVALHYWDWDAAAPNIFASDFMGAPDNSEPDEFDIKPPIFDDGHPLEGWDTDLPFADGELMRQTNIQTGAPTGMRPLDPLMGPSLVASADYGDYSNGHFAFDVEVFSHNPAHGWPCTGGHVQLPQRSAADPLFYLLHSQIDRQWAYWQREHNRHGIVGGAQTFEAPEHYDNAGDFDDPGNVDHYKGAFLEDGQWPWDGTTGGAGRAQRPANQGTMGFDENTPDSLPVIPMTPFPASVRRNLWPATDAIPRPRNLIDYLGKFVPQDGLGFCYDDVPYQE